MSTQKNKIAVLVEAHFDETEYRRFDEFFSSRGYEVEYVSHLWGQSSLTFDGNEMKEKVTASVEVNKISPSDYAGVILIGGYAMDRLRYEEHPEEGRPNQAPAVNFLRKAVKEMDAGRLPIGTICHSLWLFCASPDLLAGRKVTCAHNLISDVKNAGAVLVYGRDKEGRPELADTHVDGCLVTGRHPGVVEKFMAEFDKALESRKR